jgi:hypothetical protein
MHEEAVALFFKYDGTVRLKGLGKITRHFCHDSRFPVEIRTGYLAKANQARYRCAKPLITCYTTVVSNLYFTRVK